MRVYEIARTVGVPNSDVKNYLSFIGQPVKTSSTQIKDEVMVSAVIARLMATKNDDFVLYRNQPHFYTHLSREV